MPTRTFAWNREAFELPLGLRDEALKIEKWRGWLRLAGTASCCGPPFFTAELARPSFACFLRLAVRWERHHVPCTQWLLQIALSQRVGQGLIPVAAAGPGPKHAVSNTRFALRFAQVLLQGESAFLVELNYRDLMPTLPPPWIAQQIAAG